MANTIIIAQPASSFENVFEGAIKNRAIMQTRDPLYYHMRPAYLKECVFQPIGFKQ